MLISIIAHPNSRNPRVEKDLLETIHVYIKEPPLEGKANKAVLESLAIFLNMKKSQVSLVSGAKSKSKTFEISS